MRIGMLLEAHFPPDLRVENEMRSLVAAGHEITLFCLTHQRRDTDVTFAPGIFLKRLYLNRQFFKKFRTTVLRWPCYAGYWQTFVNPNKSLDAIHVHDLPLARVGRSLAQKFQIPLILDLHENYPAAIRVWGHDRKWPGTYFYARAAWEKYELTMANTAARVIVVVEEARTRLIQAGVAAKKIVVVSNTLNLDEIETPFTPPLPSTASDLTMTYFGGLGEHRGLEVVIQALPALIKMNPALKLVIIGDGSNRGALEQLVAARHLETQVQFMGWQRVERLSDALKWIQVSDICLVPYSASDHTETTIPHKLFQYMYLAKPVLVSSCKPLQRIVDETQAGLVFKADDPEDFARVAPQLFDLTTRQQMGMNGRRAVIEKYHWRRDAERLAQLYATVAEVGEGQSEK